jgi:hypothetical protein
VGGKVTLESLDLDIDTVDIPWRLTRRDLIVRYRDVVESGQLICKRGQSTSLATRREVSRTFNLRKNDI